jgi:hypothetical protein
VGRTGALRALWHIFPQDPYPFLRAAIRSRWASETKRPGSPTQWVDGTTKYRIMQAQQWLGPPLQ